EPRAPQARRDRVVPEERALERSRHARTARHPGGVHRHPADEADRPEHVAAAHVHVHVRVRGARADALGTKLQRVKYTELPGHRARLNACDARFCSWEAAPVAQASSQAPPATTTTPCDLRRLVDFAEPRR